MDLAAAAAFTAAALSLVNVAISYRFASRGHREEWRREQERPIVARCLTLSETARDAWWEMSEAKQHQADGDADAESLAGQHWERGTKALHDLLYEVAQLDLLASHPVRDAASALAIAHETAAIRVRDAKPGQENFPSQSARNKELHKLQRSLIERTRTDLGLGAGPVQSVAEVLGH